MSRHFAVLMAACAIGATAGTAVAKPPGGGLQPSPDIQPVNPPAASLCPQLPHPTPACNAVTVSCPSSAKSQIACTTTGTSGPANANVRKLGLQLPRRYVKAGLLCQANGDIGVSCTIVSLTSGGATGVHVTVVRLPTNFTTLRLSCTSRGKLACTVKRLS